MGIEASIENTSVVFQGDLTAVIGAEKSLGLVVSIPAENLESAKIVCRLVAEESTVVAYVPTPSIFQFVEDNLHIPPLTTMETRRFLELDLCTATAVKARKGVSMNYTIQDEFPPSMEATLGSENFSIRYNVEVWLRLCGHESRNILLKVQPLQVQKAAKRHDEDKPLRFNPHRESLYAMGSMYQGAIFLGLQLQHSELHAGEPMTVNYAAVNHSTAQIKSIDITLEEKVTFRANGISSIRTRTLFRQSTEAANTGLSLPAQVGEPTVNEDFAIKKIAKLLNAGTSKFTVAVPDTTTCTYDGGIVTIKHSITIEACTAFGTNNARATYDITILPARAPAQPVPSKPQSTPMPGGKTVVVAEDAPASIPAASPSPFSALRTFPASLAIPSFAGLAPRAR
jgi:hypothetical protein